ncbi:hypothetical protein HOLleu_04107 [Holothuria leucospilota]|uniref:SRCR domain-containing protein n=1 Tax=Holothuria leucospilota TaxID=206669 RepID=A0A9Q1CSU3_HOLLE|nr:hypothetical protein HOLleu_04107 [Holothuria leucospilota]
MMLFRLLLVTGLLAVLTSAHEEDACINGRARLIDGENYYTGTAQFCKNGRWVYFIYTGWGDTQSRLLCNQLGYSQADSYQSLPDNENIEFVSISCLGRETAISQCFFTFSGLSSHRSAVYVTCKRADFKRFWNFVEFWRLLQLCEALLVIIGILVWMVRICWGCGCCNCCPCKKRKKEERNKRKERGNRNEREEENVHRNGQRQYVRTSNMT